MPAPVSGIGLAVGFLVRWGSRCGPLVRVHQAAQAFREPAQAPANVGKCIRGHDGRLGPVASDAHVDIRAGQVLQPGAARPGASDLPGEDGRNLRKITNGASRARRGRAPISLRPMETTIHDRFNAWISDPETRRRRPCRTHSPRVSRRPSSSFRASCGSSLTGRLRKAYLHDSREGALRDGTASREQTTAPCFPAHGAGHRAGFNGAPLAPVAPS